ncbi:unnamed protein product, partial [Iphiclides podalirius]
MLHPRTQSAMFLKKCNGFSWIPKRFWRRYSVTKELEKKSEKLLRTLPVLLKNEPGALSNHWWINFSDVTNTP